MLNAGQYARCFAYLWKHNPFTSPGEWVWILYPFWSSGSWSLTGWVLWPQSQSKTGEDLVLNAGVFTELGEWPQPVLSQPVYMQLHINYEYRWKVGCWGKKTVQDLRPHPLWLSPGHYRSSLVLLKCVHILEMTGFGNRQNDYVPPLAECVTWARPLHLSLPQLVHLLNGYLACFVELPCSYLGFVSAVSARNIPLHFCIPSNLTVRLSWMHEDIHVHGVQAI